jgi:exonuclease III
MTDNGLPSLRFLTHNVNGMRGKDRRRTLFATLMDDGYDVIALQETHEAANTPVRTESGNTAVGAAGDGTLALVFSEGQQWAKEGAGPTRPWPGTTFWTPGVEGSRGVALLFSAKASEDLEPALLTADPHGQYISASCTFHGQAFTVTAVYAPCVAAERTAFFSQSLLLHLDPTEVHLTLFWLCWGTPGCGGCLGPCRLLD